MTARPDNQAATRVVNLRFEPYDPSRPDHVYIGRANGRWRLKGSKWANPFPVRREAERAAMIAAYRDYLQERPDLLQALPELRGKILFCWCRPKEGFNGRLLCHGQVLAGLVEGVAPESID